MAAVLSAPAAVAQEVHPVAPVVTDAMVAAYLKANDAYWQRKDELPPKIGKWRAGTVDEATRESLAAALAVPPELDVRRILLDVVPGDGNGQEVYAESVADVERRLCEMGDRTEELESKLAHHVGAFKNFHRSLCARFGYIHDEANWRRDLVSLEEHIAALAQTSRPVLAEVAAERQRQDEKWGGPAHDDSHATADFVQLIQDYSAWVRVMAGMGSPDKARRSLVQVAALAVAAAVIERYGRTGRIGFSGPEFQKAKYGVLVMDELAAIADVDTAQAAAAWSDRKLAALVSAERQKETA